MTATELIFVFGSNLAGRHGKGAALAALRFHGAVYGQGEGLQGQSYGIPTKDHRLEALPLAAIAEAVQRFLAFARSRPDLTFEVTAIGTGLAGYKPSQIALLFRSAPTNVHLPSVFKECLTP